MYGSRKVNTKVRFAQNHLEGRLVTGVALGGAGEGLVPRARSPTPLPKAPPSPTPPSPQPPDSSDEDDVDEEDEYTRQLREQTKAKLESITGRMFQVLNDYEGEDGAGVYIQDIGNQVDMIKNNELKANIQLMIADYKDMCEEREEILSSLEDWFEEAHVDDLLQEVADRRMSVAANPEALRKSLMEGKMASEKLKVINEQLEDANSHGLPTSQLKQQKEELEQELMKTMQLVEGGPVKEEAEPISTAVKDSWKFAAVEICDLLHQVRDSGLEDVQFMEGKINNLLASMHEQTEVIDKLNNDLQLQKQHAVFSDMTTSKLSNDNALLKEEADMLREELLEAKETINNMGLDLKTNARELEGLKNKSKTTPAKGKQSLTTEVEKLTAKYEMQLSQLSKQAETLQQEKETLILECADLQEQLEEARDLFEDESVGHKAELEMMMSTQHQQQEDSRPSSSDCTKPVKQQLTQNPTQDTATAKPMAQGGLTQSQTSTVKSAVQPARKPSITLSQRGERRSLVPHGVDHYRVQLIDKETQLHVAHKETERLTGLLQNMEEEVKKMRQENTELVKLHERSAAVINQASTCLQIKGEQTEEENNSRDKPVISTPQSFTSTSSGSPAVVHINSPADYMKGANQEHITVTSPVANSVNVLEGPARVNSSIPPRQSHGETVASTQHSDSEPPPSYWSVMGSIDTKTSLKEMAEKNQDESIQLVLSLLEKVNANQSDFATADSKALNQVHTELQKVCQVIKRFLEYSTDIVSREADVVSSAVDSLMTQLPEEEKPNIIDTTGKANLQTPRRSIYEANYADRKVLKERVVHFADQAIEVLKAGERVLTTKINSQQKNLQTVLHAMEDHKRRQSQAFRFEAPDIKGLVLEAHAVSSHNINEEQEQKQRDHRRDKLEILRQYATRSINHSHWLQRRAGHPLRGLRNGLFGLNMTSFSLGGMGASNMMGVPTDPRRSGRNQSGFDISSPRQQFNILQINTTDHERPEATQNSSFSYSVGPNTQPHGRHHGTHLHSHSQGLDHHANVTKKNRRKPKLYKPFHYSEPMSGGSYVPPMTAPAGTRGRNKSGMMGGGIPQSRAGTTHKKKKIVFMSERNNGEEQSYRPPQSGNLNNLLNYTGNAPKSNTTVMTTHADSTGLKLPPIYKA